jgi:adenosine deaminase
MLVQELYKKMKEFPKVDLHRHLEGSIRVETLLDIAQKEKVKLPTYDPKNSVVWFKCMMSPQFYQFFK